MWLVAVIGEKHCILTEGVWKFRQQFFSGDH